MSEYGSLAEVIESYTELRIARTYGVPPTPTAGRSGALLESIAPFPPPEYSTHTPTHTYNRTGVTMARRSRAFRSMGGVSRQCVRTVRPAVDTQWTDPERSMEDLFGIKCSDNLVDRCTAIDCDHTFRSVGEVVTRLMSLGEQDLVSTYSLVTLRCPLFEAFFPAYVGVFAAHGLRHQLVQMMADCRLHKFTGAASIAPIFTVLKSMQMEEATRAMIRNLWVPAEAHTFKEVTIAVLEVLASSDWTEYNAEFVRLTKEYGFTIPTKVLRNMLCSTAGKETWKKAAVPLLAIIPSHFAQRPDILALIKMIQNF